MFLIPIDLTGQASVLCSGELTSFREYRSIMYPYLPRRAQVEATFHCELAIMPGGRFTYKLLNPILQKELISYQMQEAMVNSFSGWRFRNETTQNINLKLTVDFELSGTVGAEDTKVVNEIAFDDSNIVIKVIAAAIIPNYG